MIYYTIIAASLMGLALLVRTSHPTDRPVLGILSASVAYYCLAGSIYWVEYQGNIFGAIEWPRQLVLGAAAVLAASTASLGAIIALGGRWSRDSRDMVFSLSTPAFASARRMPEPAFYAALALGVITSVFVLANGSFSSNFTVNSRNQFLLIAYQISDILVAVIAYDVARRRGFSVFNLSLVAYFCFYATLVGFRYKIALVAIPLALCTLYSDMPPKRKYTQFALWSVMIFALFSFMTIFRVKFGRPDFTRAIANPVQDIIYGAFAESNTIFGMASVLRVHVVGDLPMWFAPLVDAGKELLPRFLFPARTSGEYLRPMQLGFLTDQGIRSGTAYPWIAEFCIMFAKFGLIIGPLILAVSYTLIKSAIRQSSSSRQMYVMGLFLISGVVGYYHFGRGYFPQMLKCYLFVVLPYIIMCWSAKGGRPLPKMNRAGVVPR